MRALLGIGIQAANTYKLVFFPTILHRSRIGEGTTQSKVSIPTISAFAELETNLIVTGSMRKLQFPFDVAGTYKITFIG
ncbi:MAG TPA: hypothetical protein VIL31_15360, partial [Cyclobacteriaceae bacterium]